MSNDVKSVTELKEKILGISELPTLPAVVIEIIELVQHESASSAADVAQVMNRDPVLTASVLRLANSAGYSRRANVETLDQALVVLGYNVISNLVQSFAVIQAFKDREFEEDFDLDAFWDHSVGTAEISRSLAARIGLNFGGAEFTAGLIHDIGKVILELYFHRDFSRALKASRAGKTPLYEKERKIWGVDHTDIGAWLAEKWQLPKRLVDVIHNHHNVQAESDDQTLVAVVHLSNTLAKVADIGFSGDRVVFDLKNNPAWKILEQATPEMGEFDLARFTFELDERVAQARDFLRIARR
jgi:putative nucleotidyltransferase with HDIG domain